MDKFRTLPPQQLPYKKKGKKWREAHLDWADDHSYINSSLVRKSVLNKQINYDLVNGVIHLNDMMLVLNPTELGQVFVPDAIQHYPVINSKINVLRGEESARRFDYKVICTNPNAISEIERQKTSELHDRLQKLVESGVTDEKELQRKLQELDHEFKYSWQELREIRANALLNHYYKEYNIPYIFSQGFMDALTVGEEIYRCHIVNGEPVIDKINPMKIRLYRSGNSSRVEDADIIIVEDYWSLGKIYDVFHEALTEANRKSLETLVSNGNEENWYDERDAFINAEDFLRFSDGVAVGDYVLFSDHASGRMYDDDGNIRVLQCFWKSRRKMLKVKSYDQQTGDVKYDFYTEEYVPDESMGEEAEVVWVNEAWEGYKLGKDVYVDIKPCEVQYNRLTNPSRCHFGFVGSIYNVNEDRVFSLVDMLKPFAYLYDVVHERLNKAMDATFGQMYELDLASVPDGWEIEKWLYYARNNHLAIKDSFKAGNEGPAKGKIAGAFAANSRGIIGNDTGNYIQQQVNLLEFIQEEMASACGITKQREGNIGQRETVGGVERSTLQSSYITEWLFNTHNDVKRRVMECFLETAKAAAKGKSLKLQYCLDDLTTSLITIDGDEFAENDYGLVVDNSPYSSQLNQKLEQMAQFALQSGVVDFSTCMKIFTNPSLIETQRMIEESEQKKMQQAQQEQENQKQMQQALLESNEKIKQFEMEMAQAKLALEEQKNIRDNETRLQIAELQAQTNMANADAWGKDYDREQNREELMQKIREFDEKISLDREKANLERYKVEQAEKQAQRENELKQRELDIKQKESAQKARASNTKSK